MGLGREKPNKHITVYQTKHFLKKVFMLAFECYSIIMHPFKLRQTDDRQN